MDSREDPPMTARRMTMVESSSAVDPLYKQVRAALVESLATGEWKPGEVIPSERKLAQRYGVAVATIRAATSELAAMKVLSRRQGRGTYVCREDERRNIYQFFHVVRNDGARELPVSELVWIRKRRADLDTAHALDLPRDPAAQSVYLVRNILKVSGVPVVVSDIAIAVSRFPGLTEQRIRAGGPTLYAVYQSEYGINIVRTDEKLRAIRCDTDTARLLRVRRGAPVLEVRRLAYTFNEEVVEVRRSMVQTTDYHYALSRGGH
ncbi:MAG TPA: GntR family transcriptional regulator [Casimicrobiaceae bacterium]|nr:GntR family transcriptional regulator [Casimicrobiaceae bacterium]